MLIIICVLVLLYTMQGAVGVPTACFVLAWVSLGLHMACDVFNYAKAIYDKKR